MAGPEAAAGISAVGQVVNGILPIAIKEIQDRIKKREGFEDLVGSLQFCLSRVQGTILRHRNQIRRGNNAMHLEELTPLIANLRCLAYDMDDCIEAYDAKTLKGDSTDYDKLANLKESVQVLVDQTKELNRLDGAGSSSSNPQVQGNEAGFPLADLVVENDHISELLKLVIGSFGSPSDKLTEPVERSGSPSDELRVFVISIVGFGGIGKTHLSYQLYKTCRNHFKLHAFVRAGHKGGREVLQEILKELFGVIVNGDNVMKKYLREDLRAHRYLIVVDDVQSEKLGSFITRLFSNNNKGSRIIIAMTTVTGLTAESSDGHMCKMKPLQDDKSVKQFLKEATAHLKKKEKAIAEQDGSSMQKICDGVPLAFVSICEVRRGDFNRDDVKEAWNELGETEAKLWRQRMREALRHSYDRIYIFPPGCSSQNQYMSDLQACLLYFAMFPPGHCVKRGPLIRRCLAEGTDLGSNSTSVEGACRNLQILVDRNFIWPIQVSMHADQHVKAFQPPHMKTCQPPHVKTCQPPGVVLEYIAKTCKEEDFIALSCDGAARKPNPTRRLSLHTTDPPQALPPRLRTLAASSIPAKSIAECKWLRVLDLEEYHGLQEDELDEICKNLCLLKYLGLRSDSITQIPSSISNLHRLETLDVGTQRVVLVPIEVLDLPSLKHLLGKLELLDSISRALKVILRRRIEARKLERLQGFVTRTAEGFPPLMQRGMDRLRKVKIWFHDDADAKSITANLPDAINKFLPKSKKKQSIEADNHRTLFFDLTNRRSLSIDTQECKIPGRLLDSLAKASGSLYSLKLCGRYQTIQKIPSFAAKLGITKLCLSWTKEVLSWKDILDALSKLPNLEYLKIVAKKIEAVRIEIKTGEFDGLKRMWLETEEYLPRLEIQAGALNGLVSLHLICKELDGLSADQISKLNSLEEVALLSCLGNVIQHTWKDAARDMKLYVLFIEDPCSF